MRASVMLVGLMLGVGSLMAADFEKVVPEGTAVVVRVDWRALTGSALATEIIDKNLERYTAGVEGLRGATGVDMAKISRVWLMAEKENSGAILMEGDVSAASVQAKLGAVRALKASSRDGWDFYAEYLENKLEKVVAVRGALALAGDRAYTLGLLEVLDGRAAGVTGNPVLEAMAADKSTVSVALLRVNDQMRKRNPEIAALLKSGNLSVNVDESVQARLDLETHAPDQAEGLQMMAQGMIAIQAAQLRQMAAATDQFPAAQVRQAGVVEKLLRTLKITRDGSAVSATWNLSPEARTAIEQALEARKAAEIAVP